MKVLFLTIDVASRHGGIQRFNQRVLRCLDGLRAGGDEVRVISVRDEPHAAGGVTVTGARGSKPLATAKALGAIVAWRPDLILLGHVMLTPVAVAARVLCPRATSLLFVHGYEVWDDPDLLSQPEWQKVATRTGVHRIVSVSRHTADRMREAFKLGDKPIDILPNALDLEAESGDAGPTTTDANTAPAGGWPRGDDLLDARQVLTVSRMDEWGKGVDWVIRALPHVIERIGPVKYVIAGDGKLRPDHVRVAEEFGVADHVTFAGRVSDAELERLYRTSAAFALPSTKEGFGIVYLEAWKHGLPVIAGNRDAGAEVVDDGVNGRVVDPTDAKAIAEALVELLSDPEKAARLGRAGNEKLRREYGHERFDARLRDILLGAAGRNTPGDPAETPAMTLAETDTTTPVEPQAER